jgi:D-amino-acid dehydrogenase
MTLARPPPGCTRCWGRRCGQRPAAATLDEVRVGLRPASRDGLPILGPVPGHPNLHLATGHGPYGLQVGPWSGAAVADLALGDPVGLDLGPYSAGRYSPA